MGLNLWPILCEYTVSFFKITIICKRKMRGLRKVLFIMILYKAVSNLCGASQIFCVILVSFYRDLVLRNNIFQCTFPNTYINLCFLHIWKEISPTEASQSPFPEFHHFENLASSAIYSPPWRNSLLLTPTHRCLHFLPSFHSKPFLLKSHSDSSLTRLLF